MELLISRKIDDLGRIVLPQEQRKRLGWNTGDTLGVYYVDTNTLILQAQNKPMVSQGIVCDEE